MERQLLALASEPDCSIFDAWFLGWLVRGDVLRAWLDASLEVRAARIKREIGEGESLETCRRVVAAKDARAAHFAKERYGIDLFAGRDTFDIVLCCVEGTTRETVDETLHRIVQTWWRLEDTTESTAHWDARIIARCPVNIRQLL